MLFDFSTYLDNIALITDRGDRVTYRQLDGYCAALAENIEKRSLIFILCANTMGALAGYVTALKYQHVPLMLDENIDEQQLREYITKYQPDYLYVPCEKAAQIDGAIIYAQHGYALLKRVNTKTALHDELALLLTTSGSTGSPKFVRQSYKNIRSNTDAIIQYLNIDTAERTITSLPMNYTYGLSVINTHLNCGASVVLTTATIMQREFWSVMKEQEVTSLAGVPFTYAMLKKLRFMNMVLPALKTLTQAGGKLPPELHREFAQYATENQKSFIVMYGAAEATARMGYLSPDKAIEKYGSIGIPIPGGRFAIVDETGQEITQPECVGELIYWGDNVVLGYAECGADLCCGDTFQGRLQTGDMVRCDHDGYFYVVGRKKRFLKIFGNRVGLDDVEARLCDAFPSLDCACAGVDDKMYVFITDDSASMPVKQFLVQQTKLNHTAFKIVLIPQIPKNGAGKTLYSQLETYYAAL